MKTYFSGLLLSVSSSAALVMLLCAIAVYIEVLSFGYDETGRAMRKPSSLFRSKWFFYFNATMCLLSVGTLYFLD